MNRIRIYSHVFCEITGDPVQIRQCASCEYHKKIVGQNVICTYGDADDDREENDGV
jgi:hypothetical protein